MSNIKIIDESEDFRKVQITPEKSYCFTITLATGEVIYLTSSAETIELDEKKYLSDSGLQLIELKQDDSADDIARISGIFEEKGISNNMNLCGAKIHIGLLTPEKLHDIAVYYCVKFEKYDLNFEIIAQPLTSRYATEAVLKFSKTCRATLGDNKCKIDLEKYARKYDIADIRGRSIILSHVKEPTGYYTGGKIELRDQDKKIAVFSIISHADNIITLNKKVDSILITPHLNIKIYPGCDRKLISCCKKFNNVLNFRGEPFVPEFKILEN